LNILVARNHGFVNCLLVLDYVSISMGIFVKVLSHLRCVVAFTTNIFIEIMIWYAQT
jgi:hypothetical protein